MGRRVRRQVTEWPVGACSGQMLRRLANGPMSVTRRLLVRPKFRVDRYGIKARAIFNLIKLYKIYHSSADFLR